MAVTVLGVILQFMFQKCLPEKSSKTTENTDNTDNTENTVTKTNDQPK